MRVSVEGDVSQNAAPAWGIQEMREYSEMLKTEECHMKQVIFEMSVEE